MVSELIQVAAAVVAQAAPVAESELVRILERFVLPFATGLGAFYLSRLQARKEQRLGQASIEATTRAEISAERGKLSQQWEGTTERMSALLDSAYRRLEIAVTEAASAKLKSERLEQELAEVRRLHKDAVDELERLKRQQARRARPRD